MPKFNSAVSVESVAGLYQAGATVQNISFQLGVSTWTVLDRLKRAGTHARTARERRGLTLHKEHDIAERYRRGDSMVSIVGCYNIDKSTVWRIVEEHNVTRRKRGGRLSHADKKRRAEGVF